MIFRFLAESLNDRQQFTGSQAFRYGRRRVFDNFTKPEHQRTRLAFAKWAE
jgi:hypothetical protein